MAGIFPRKGADGQLRWLQASYNPLLDDAAKPYRILKIALDVTTERQALLQSQTALTEAQLSQEELRTTEQRYRRQRQELLTQNEQLQLALNLATQPDLARARRFTWDDDLASGSLNPHSLMIDLLETRRVKQAIEANPGEVAQTLESTPLAICITNAQGHFAYVNNNYCALYGYSREELIGHSFVVVVPKEKQEFMQKLHDQFIREKCEIGRTWTVVGKDGQPITIDVDTGYTEQLGGPHKITLIQKLSWNEPLQ